MSDHSLTPSAFRDEVALAPASEGDEVTRAGVAADLQALEIGNPRDDAELTVAEYIKRHCLHLSHNFDPTYPDDIGTILIAKAAKENVVASDLEALIGATAKEMYPYHIFLRANAELINHPKHRDVTRRFYRLAARHGAAEPDYDLARIRASYADTKTVHQTTVAGEDVPAKLAPDQFSFDASVESLTAQMDAAVYVLQTAFDSPRASTWPLLDWRTVMEQAIARVQNPFSTDIRGPYFCGPTFTLSVFIEKDPMLYARTVIEVMSKGTFAGRAISPELRAAVPNHNYGSLSVDWMMMSSLRNTNPNMFGRYMGEDEDDYAKDDRGTLISRLGKQERNRYPNIRAGTSVAQMHHDIENVLGYQVVESAYFWQEDVIQDVAPNRFVKGGLQKMIELLPESYDADTPYVAGMLIGMNNKGDGNRMKWDDKKRWGTQIGTNVDAIHWLRIVTKPKKTGDSYEFEMFEHGDKSATTYTETYLDEDVYGYVIARRP